MGSNEKQYIIEIEQLDQKKTPKASESETDKNQLRTLKISTLRDNHPLDYLKKGPSTKAKSPKPTQALTPIQVTKDPLKDPNKELIVNKSQKTMAPQSSSGQMRTGEQNKKFHELLNFSLERDIQKMGHDIKRLKQRQIKQTPKCDGSIMNDKTIQKPQNIAKKAVTFIESTEV